MLVNSRKLLTAESVSTFSRSVAMAAVCFTDLGLVPRRVACSERERAVSERLTCYTAGATLS